MWWGWSRWWWSAETGGFKTDDYDWCEVGTCQLTKVIYIYRSSFWDAVHCAHRNYASANMGGLYQLPHWKTLCFRNFHAYFDEFHWKEKISSTTVPVFSWASWISLDWLLFGIRIFNGVFEEMQVCNLKMNFQCLHIYFHEVLNGKMSFLSFWSSG